MKTVAVIFGLIFLVYLAAWLGSLDMAARIAALLLIAVKAVGLGALVVLCWKVKKQWDRMEEKLDAMWNCMRPEFLQTRAQWPGGNLDQPLRFCEPEITYDQTGACPRNEGPGVRRI